MMRMLIAAGALLTSMTLPLLADGSPKLKVCMLSGSEEYESDRTLLSFKEWLEAKYPVQCVLLKAKGVAELPGLEALKNCDVALFFTRRLTIDGPALNEVKAYVEAGRPVVGVRTASHGFQNWLDFDKLVLGGNYKGHFKKDVPMEAVVVPEAKNHPVVAGVGPIKTLGSLYKNTPIDPSTTLLMAGTSVEGREPVAWTREYKGGRVFYTSLGAQEDFENPAFLGLLRNALFWAAKRQAP